MTPRNKTTKVFIGLAENNPAGDSMRAEVDGPNDRPVAVPGRRILGFALRHGGTPRGCDRPGSFASPKQFGMRSCHNPAVAWEPTAEPTEAVPASLD